ncbi:hypothetical protein [Legionella septentrionalis]|nr:hypothetical protein [Legionella septentrionalis]
MNKLPISLTDFIDFEFVQQCSGKEIDKMIQSLGGNFLSQYSISGDSNKF